VVGKTISHYRILEKIGEGGMGVVYRAEDTKLGRTVALKFLSQDLTGDRAHRERFLREAQVVSTLEHQNICTIHEIDETDDGQVFICMACYEGDTLKDIIGRGRVSPGEAIRFSLQIARGLVAAHEAGITHRDVKPGNVMVSETGHVRLVDFGLAKLAGQSSLTKSGNAVGTVAYMSPEQTRGEEVDERTDVWALGVLLYEMVAGRRPFSGDGERAVIRAIQQDRPDPLSQVVPSAPPLSEIIAKALEKKAGKRYGSMSEMLEDLRALARELELSDESRTETWRYARAKERRLRIAATVSAAAVVALLVLWGIKAARAEKPLPVGIPMQVTSGDEWEGEPAISPDGTRIAYVSTASGNSDVYVTDVLGGRVLQLTTDPGTDFAPTWFPDGSAIAFVSDRSGQRDVWKVGQFGGGATMLLENAEYPAISPDGTCIAFSGADDSGELRIWVTSLDGLSQATKLTTGEHGLWDHVCAAWSPDGRTLSYSSQTELWSVSVEGGVPRRLTLGRASGTGAAWSSDGRYIYFDSWRERTLALWRVPSRGGEPRRMTQGTGYESEPRVSADGSRLAYSTGSLGQGAMIINLETGQETTIGQTRSSPLLASLSRDGSRMVFMSERWGRRGELAEQLLDGGVPSGPPRRLTDQEGNASHPVYSPDGRWIAYYLIKDGERDIWIIPAGGGRPLQFTDGPGQDVHPAWSPNGGVLAFMSVGDGTRDLWVAPVHEGKPAGEPRRLTATLSGISPVWSPDGTEIAFVASDGGRMDIWLVPSDGGAPARRLTDGVDASRIRWDASTGMILAAATCGEERRSLWAVSPETGEAELFDPAVVFGTERAIGLFDLSQESRLLVFSRESLTGDIWVSEGPPGLY
jgi:Tol biopolymer transport system component